jgi:hypothetical protein
MPIHNRHRRGNGMLEAALVLLVFLAVLIGIFDFAQVLFVHQTFTARLRAAARFGVVRTYDPDAIRNMVLYGQPNAPVGATSGTFGLAAGNVLVTRLGAGTSGERLVVTISGYPYRLFSPWIGGTFTGRPLIASLSMETP